MTGKKTNGAGDVLGTDKTLWGSKGERSEVPEAPKVPTSAPEAAETVAQETPPEVVPVEYDGPMQVNVQPQVLNGRPTVNLSLVWKVKGQATLQHATAALDVSNAVIVAASLQNAALEAQIEGQARVEAQLLQAWLTAESRHTNPRNVPDIAWAMNQMRSYREFKELAMRSFQAMRNEAAAQDQAPAAEPEGGVP